MRQFVISVCLVSLVGCAGPAHFVSKQGTEGVVAVPEGTNQWPHYYHNQALDLIRSHVGSDFEIVKEEQVTTGQVTRNDQHVDTESHPHILPWASSETQRVQNTATTTDVTEWRITYRKRTGPSVGASTGIQTVSDTSILPPPNIPQP
ncbi:MAG: hypothetical protein U0798_04150 [Gemmataceae bacterium]